jgi:hypothetical protein
MSKAFQKGLGREREMRPGKINKERSADNS